MRVALFNRSHQKRQRVASSAVAVAASSPIADAVRNVGPVIGFRRSGAGEA